MLSRAALTAALDFSQEGKTPRTFQQGSTMTELKSFAAKNGVKFILFNFTDLLGAQRAKLVPASGNDNNMYTEPHNAKGAKGLPLNFLDALRAFHRDKVLGAAIGEEFSKAYVKLKTEEWNNHMRHLTNWLRERTLDC